MSHRILIVDDDPDFASLMGDIFSQGGYMVQTVAKSEEVPAILNEQSFDMVVSDLEMPSLSGSELTRYMKEYHPGIPIVMVSGYLDESRIKSLRGDGVVDFFNKPLNIFSLLKKTQAILSHGGSGGGESGFDSASPATNEPGGDPSDQIESEVHSFPGRAAASREFMATLRREVRKQSHMVLVDEAGSPEEEIGRDISRWLMDKSDCLVVPLRGGEVSEDSLRSVLEKAHEQGAGSLVLYLYDSEELSERQQEMLYSSTRPQPLGTDWNGTTRLILVVRRSLDELLQEQRLTEALYLMLGGIELNIPPLRECPEDIEPIAQTILSRLRPDQTPTLTGDAVQHLRSQSWPGNWCELETVLTAAVEQCQGSTLDASDLRAPGSP